MYTRRKSYQSWIIAFALGLVCCLSGAVPVPTACASEAVPTLQLSDSPANTSTEPTSATVQTDMNDFTDAEYRRADQPKTGTARGGDTVYVDDEVVVVCVLVVFIVVIVAVA